MPDAQTPPWGNDFDAEKAWTLLQNVRKDKTDLIAEKATLVGQVAELQTAIQAKADEKLEDKLAAAEKSLFVERALRKHPEAEEFLDFLTGETEDEITAKAERLAKAGKPKGDPKPDDKKGDDKKGDETPNPADLQRRPGENLTPGHGGEQTVAFDAKSIASEIISAPH